MATDDEKVAALHEFMGKIRVDVERTMTMMERVFVCEGCLARAGIPITDETKKAFAAGFLVRSYAESVQDALRDA